MILVKFRVMKISCLALFLACFSFAPLGASPRFEVVRDSAGFVPRWSCGQFVVTPPAEGLWSIATAWRDGAPAEWRHVRAVTCERTGEWTILSGRTGLPRRPVAAARRLPRRGRSAALHPSLRVDGRSGARFGDARYPVAAAPMSGAAFSAGDPLLRQSVGRAQYARQCRALRRPGRRVRPFRRTPLSDAGSLRSRSNAANVARQHRSLRCPARSPIRVMRITGGRSACGRRTGIPNCCCCRDRSATMVVRGPAKRSKGEFATAGQYLAVRPGTVIEKEFRLAIDPAPLRGAAFRRPVHRALELYAPFSCEGLRASRRSWRRNAS